MLTGPFDARPLHQRAELMPPGGIPEISAAKYHESARLQAVGELFSLLGILACKGVIEEEAGITVSGARLQHGVGSSDDDTEAAHRIPGQVFIDGLSLDQYVEYPPGSSEAGMHDYMSSKGFNSQALRDLVRSIFARTDVAMSRVNKTDSLIENRHPTVGLKEVLALTAGLAVSSPLHGKLYRAKWYKVQQTAEFAFCYYRERAIVRVKHAEDQKMQERNRLHSTKTAAREKVELTILMLRAYLDVLTSAPLPPPVTATGFPVFRARVMFGE